jgi:hypothetical protein
MLMNAVAGLMVFVWRDGSCGDEAVRTYFSVPWNVVLRVLNDLPSIAYASGAKASEQKRPRMFSKVLGRFGRSSIDLVNKTRVCWNHINGFLIFWIFELRFFCLKIKKGCYSNEYVQWILSGLVKSSKQASATGASKRRRPMLHGSTGDKPNHHELVDAVDA